MAERRITLQIDIDLAKHSKEAHAVTIEKIAKAVAAHAVELIEDKGYSIRRASATTTMHYVRHVLPVVLRKPKVTRLKKVG